MQVFKSYWYCFLFLSVVISGCKLNTDLSTDVNILIEWNKAALDTEIYTEGIAVPISARFFGYYGIIPLLVDSYHNNDLTFVKKTFPDLNLPKVENNFNRSIALNIAYYEFISKYYINLHYKNREYINLLFEKWDTEICLNEDSKLVENSKKLGLTIARELLQWSNQDSVASLAYLHNFDRNYIPLDEVGKWKIDDEHPMPALLPNWGKVILLNPSLNEIKCKPPTPYSDDRSSEYYVEALELFTISSPLSYENKWIAEFWSDDVRGLTLTPAGRWISILCQIILQEESSFDKAKESFFKLGIGLCDGAIITWKYKYYYNVERPETYIRKYIHEDWRPYHNSPNFPGYPSGHSVFGGVCAEILTQIFGENVKLTDISHKGRKEFLSMPRSYNSIKEMAIENAYSRIPLGVHFRMDCKEGMRLGYEIGKELNKLDIHSGKTFSKN